MLLSLRGILSSFLGLVWARIRAPFHMLSQIRIKRSESVASEEKAEIELNKAEQKETHAPQISPKPAGSKPANHNENQGKARKRLIEYGKKIVRPFAALFHLFEKHPASVSAVAAIVSALGTVAIVLLTIKYVDYSAKQWKAMNDQLPELRKSADAAKKAADTAEQSFNLAKRHAEDTDEAIFHPQPSMPKVGGDSIIIPFYNEGVATARGFHAHVEFSQNRMNDNKLVRLLTTVEVVHDEIRGKTTAGEEKFIVPNINWKPIYGDWEALVISGTMEYDDGFDRKVHTPFCTGIFFIPSQAAMGGFPARNPSMSQQSCDVLPRQFESFHPHK